MVRVVGISNVSRQLCEGDQNRARKQEPQGCFSGDVRVVVDVVKGGDFRHVFCSRWSLVAEVE
jgi:hypothetical protein